MSASNFCCTQPQQRTDSPEPPPRPLATIDGIFAAAVLPEDHPHALKLQDRKPDLDTSIVRSPNIASKIMLQFRKKSNLSLRKAKEYDEDARQMTFEEVIYNIEEEKSDEQHTNKKVDQHQRFGSVTGAEHDKVLAKNDDKKNNDVRTSVLRSLEYLKPMLQKPSEFSVSGDSYKIVEPTPGSAPSQLPKSCSFPVLPHGEAAAQYAPRSPPESELGSTLTVLKRQTAVSYGTAAALSVESRIVGTVNASAPSLHVQEPTEEDGTEVDGDDTTLKPVEASDKNLIPVSEEGIHLHNMDISQQLRSMSQLSDVADEGRLIPAPYPWNFHLRERSEVEQNSERGRHARQKSSSGIDSASVPLSWGRVRSPIRDAASSMYSRPVSSATNVLRQTTPVPDIPPYEIPNDLDALFADWPLKQTASAEKLASHSRTVSMQSSASHNRNKPLPATPLENYQDLGKMSLVLANNEESPPEMLSVAAERFGSVKSSLNRFTKGSRQNKFPVHFSPPKRMVRKRRSIYKFLRPGSRKQQVRSISSPALCAKPMMAEGIYDGPSDDPALLTVQYELSEHPNHATRSVSMSQLGTGRHQDVTTQPSAPQLLQRRPTFAEYERGLTVTGDDRRRPSTVDIQRVREVQEEDRRESVGIRHRLNRAHPLKDDASPLMAKALEKHQQEKDLFRSASKQRESLTGSRQFPMPGSSRHEAASLNLPLSTPYDQSELLDPLEKGQLKRPLGSSQSASYLFPPTVRAPDSSYPSSSIGSRRNFSTITGSSDEYTTVTQRPRQGTIGTALDSWSRYPSHTRSERCGSAGHPDKVIARDFAVNIDPEEIHMSDENEAETPASKKSTKSTAKVAKANVAMTLKSVVRYYSNLFHTSQFQGQNRRTSVTTGGRLEFPELEMLPPQMPAESPLHGHPHDSHRLSTLRQHVKEDADKFKHYVQQEEAKLEDYMKQEEGLFEDFMRKEEHKLEDFVKKEESKVMGYVKEEEDKLFHHHHHEKSSEQDGSRKSSPFRAGSIFRASSRHDEQHLKHADTTVAPKDQHRGSGKTRLQLDGTSANPDESITQTPSKAEIWSDMYKDCLRSTLSTASDPKDDIQRDTMALPALKPVKPRTPERPQSLDPKARIRRFPSVTVIDDRKGHLRSVSLISVKTSQSIGFERSSTHDLLELIQAREREEREKLLKGICAIEEMEPKISEA